MTPDELRKLGARYTSAWSSRDPLRVASFFSPAATLAVNGAPGRPVIEIAHAFMADFPDLNLAMDDIFDRNGRIEYHWTLTGTYASTGAKVRISGFEEWTLGPDGFIQKSIGHFDQAAYERQLHA